MKYYKDLKYKGYYLKHDVDNDEWWYKAPHNNIWIQSDLNEYEYIIRDVKNHLIIPIDDIEAFIDLI